MVGLHSNMLLAFPADASGIELTEQESADLAAAGAFMTRGAAYQEIQGKNPQTLGYGLTDSPAGLAGWIIEKFRAWTDNEGSPEDAVTRDQLLTNLTVYWVTKTINSSIRLYCESQRTNRFGPTGEYVTVPTAAAVFPKEMFRIPRAYAESRFNLVRYNRFDRGGHFAALEEPDLLVQDIQAFFNDLR
jgi:microsomal epoxide hydrolase